MHRGFWAVLIGMALVAEATASSRPVLARADLALALQRFESAFLAHRPEGQALVDANLEFERVTQSFFGMDFSSAIRMLNNAALKLELGRDPNPEEQRLAALRVTAAPPILDPMSPEPTIELSSLYDVPGTDPLKVEVVLAQADQRRRFPVELSGHPEGGDEQKLSLPGEWKGTWKISVGLPGGLQLDSGRMLTGVPRNLDEWRSENAARLDRLPENPELASAVATCRARNQLLKMTPSESNSAEFLADYSILSSEIDREVSRLEKGEDPYIHRRGDYWRVIARGSTKVPVRVYVPKGLSLDSPVPLVIALHGAGGDENMFMDAYGQGAIKREADRAGFIVASPATFYFLARPDYLKLLIDEVAACYPIDRKRVYVLGHSMGGGATGNLVSQRSDLIRAASCIAGFRGVTGTTICPTLVLAAELDQIVPAAGIESAVRKAQEQGLPVEYRTIPMYGHTMVVEAELPHVIDWLLKHQ